MSNFNESIRYDYDLNVGSVVFDIGGYRGEFAIRMYDKFKCKIHLFEPVKQFYDAILKNIVDRPIFLNNFGIGTRDEVLNFKMQKDATGLYSEKGISEKIKICDINKVLNANIDLMKINIEGMEFDLLENMISTGLINKVENIQVQFHNVIPDAETRYRDIQSKLSNTHECKWCFPWVWEGWTRK